MSRKSTYDDKPTTTAPSKSSSSNDDGDWLCPDSNCNNVNFARRTSCNLCGNPKPEDGKKGLGQEIGKNAAEKSRGLFSADDWQCGRCGNVNWARRSTCNVCNTAKCGDNEERTGFGGGYNDRGEVEYKEKRESSDDEFDDFGRKKKKFLKPSSSRPKDADEDEEDDDDDDGDISKYKLVDSESEESDRGDSSKNKLENKNLVTSNGHGRRNDAKKHRKSRSRSPHDRRRSRSSSHSRRHRRSRSHSRDRKDRRRSRSRSRDRRSRNHHRSSSRDRRSRR